MAQLGFPAPIALNSNASIDSGNDYEPRVASDGAGTWVAVWVTHQYDPYGGDISISRSLNGSTWSQPKLIKSGTDIDQQPDVASDGAGHWVAVWVSASTGSSNNDYDVQFSFSADNGVTWSAPQPLNANSGIDSGHDLHPSVATDGQGAWMVVWSSGENLGGIIGTDYDILFSTSKNGTTWSYPKPANTNAMGSGNHTEPRLTVVPRYYDFIRKIWVNSVWAAIWASDRGGPDYDILVATSSNEGDTWTDPIVVNTNASSDSGSDRNPQLATDGKGNWVVVWASNDSLGGTIGSDGDILVSTYGGTAWSSPKALNTNAASDLASDEHPRLATDGKGNWVAVWRSVEFIGALYQSDILFALSSDNGATWSAPKAVKTNGANDSWTDMEPSLATDGAGRWMVAWSSADPLGNTIGTDHDILVTTAIPPMVSSIQLGDPNPTTGTFVRFLVDFTSNVTGVNNADFTLTTTGTISGAAMSRISVVSQSRYSITVSTGSGTGTIRLNVTDDDSIKDSYGNPLGGLGAGNGSFSSGPAYTVDRTSPLAGTVKSATGPYSVDNTKVTFSWLDFSDPESSIAYYEVAFGNSTDPEAYMSFAPIGAVTTRIFRPSDFSGQFPEGVFPEDTYVCSVRAVNGAGLVSNTVSAEVTIDSTAFGVGQAVPLPDQKTADDIDWALSNGSPSTHVIKIQHARKFIIGDYGKTITIQWYFKAGGALTRDYQTSSDPPKDPMIIYYTHETSQAGGSVATGSPQVNLNGIPQVVIHYNEAIPNSSLLWIEGGLLSAKNKLKDTSLVVLEYNNTSNPQLASDLLGIEIVQVKPDEFDVADGAAHIGSHLLPQKSVTDATAPVVMRGGAGSSTPYIYQHGVQGSPQQGQVWAIHKNENPSNMEVIWKRKGVGEIEWPYEWRRYTADWPKTEPGKYQVYVRGDSAQDLGPSAVIPSALNPVPPIFEEFETAGHHAYLQGSSFNADGRGWVLLKYQTGPPQGPGLDWVGFEVVRSVLRTDFDPTPINKEIGTEITDPYHEGQPPAYRPGHIHKSQGDRYAPGIYEVSSGGTGQIFAVNKGLLEVWWYNLSKIWDPLRPSDRVQWPSKVVRYNAVWPSNPEKIIIARQNGTGKIDAVACGTDWTIYYQNDPTLPGFNPNDEHARKIQYKSGWAIFAVRDDLGTPETSEPYVLMKYKEQPINTRYRFRTFKVLSEEAPYFFRDWAHLSNDPGSPLYNPEHDPPLDPYEGKAGKQIQAPFPLSGWQYCNETKAISGPAFEDRTGKYWVRAAGTNGGTADITMRYYYPVQEGFYFPSGSYQVGDHVPWLDRGTGTPVDVVYTVSWPDNVPKMNIGQTLINTMNGLPDIGGQGSVDVIYQQSVSKGGGPSVALVDPVQARAVDLPNVPTDIKTESQGAEKVFVDLSLALRMRVSYDPINQKLSFKGVPVTPTAGFSYALLNVMSARERDELLALSSDAAWRSSVNALYQKAKDPILITDSSTVPYDKLALTSGFAQGVGYVTLAMQNAENLGALPVSLEIIEVIAELEKGAIMVISPPCPFDETLTLRHQGDFGGRPDEFEFEWRYLPDQDGTKPIEPHDQWLVFSSEPATGQGAIDVTIEGPGLLTLSDNWFVCRFRYMGSDPFLSSLGWSGWTDPMLAEGWIKRVVGDINPFTQRASGGGIEGAENAVSSYGDKEVNTVVSMVSQAGPPWAGSVPLNCKNLDGFGLIEIYDTVFNRSIGFSIEGLPPVDYPPANTALLLVASRIADLYALLGNEAYADAADPTIAFGTDDGQYGAEASSIHCFMNVTSDLLEEELALLRGRDDSVSPGAKVYPFYNRLIWNFTNDMTGGEVAYALNYNIQDQAGKVDGKISEADAKALYPQGHGDAWGHYLTAIKTYYRLLRHPNYTWNSRSEGLLVGGVPVTVDYLDERKFAKVAAAKARTGAELVNLTYRSAYVEDPSGQWQGYKDTDPGRAWGLSEWASRAGQGSYLDWVVGNAILPPQDTLHTGIQKIDRASALELREVASRYLEIQSQADQADLGLNPQGLATNVIPFDISPTEIDAGKTHFEQIYERAVTAVNNAITVFDHANNSTQLLRRQADNLAKFQETVEDREVDFKNRLIEIYGYPYPDDIGAGKTYPAGYDGPDLDHYTYVDPSELVGVDPKNLKIKEVPLSVVGFEVLPDGSLEETRREVVFHFSTSADRFGEVTPPTWTGERRAPGEIQMARSDLIQARARFERALSEYDNLILQIEEQADLIKAQHDLNSDEINLLNFERNEQQRLSDMIRQSRERELNLRTQARMATIVANAVSEALPAVVGLSCDATSVARSAIQIAGTVVAESCTQDADRESLAELDHQQAAQMVQSQNQINLTTLRSDFAILQAVKQLEQLVRQEITLRVELYTLQEAMQQASGRYMATMARGLRLQEDRMRFRQQTAADVQSRRYKDMAFRIFRNDALQKYRAQFDLAARYVYLAAKAYDFETTFLSGDQRAGERFLTDIVRARLIGTIQGGLPQTGTGLADPMARMSQNFGVLKGQLGFNNPQKETNRFSLRSELFRIQPGSKGNATWRETLRDHTVPNLMDVPEFMHYARLFDGPQPQEPAIVIPFQTGINFGLNFFGWPLGGGDSAYDSTNFSTKVRSVGVWFSNYNNLSMSQTPRVYLIPAGSDVLRSPTGSSGTTREFRVLDQKLPVPFPVGAGDLSDPAWIPAVDTMSDTFAQVRKFASFRAYHDSGQFSSTEVIRDSRLIGRSVWNTKWLLIIPAGTLLNDRTEALSRFIDGSLVGDTRDGNGVSDIKIFFETYAYPGN